MKSHKASTLTTIFVGICLVCILGGLGVMGYWAFWPMTVYHDNQLGPWKIMNPGRVVHSGGNVEYQVDTVFLIADVQAESSASLVGETTVQYLPSWSYSQVVGPVKHVRQVALPAGTVPGTYYLNFIATFHVNPLRDIIVHKHTETFTVE